MARAAMLAGFVLCALGACSTDDKVGRDGGQAGAGSGAAGDPGDDAGGAGRAGQAGSAGSAGRGGAMPDGGVADGSAAAPDDGGRPDSGESDDAGRGSDALRPLPVVSPPERKGTLVGPGAPLLPSGVRVYGTDLGLTYEHDGRLFVLFGDTWPDDEYICHNFPTNDDSVATLPLSRPAEGTPPLTFVTQGESPEFAPIRLLRGETSLGLGFGQAPLAGFSDGERGFAIFNRVAPMACDDSLACPFGDHFACSPTAGVCDPPLSAMTLVCDRETHAGCFPGQECAPVSLCVDTASPQQDGTLAGELASIAQEIEIAAQRPDSPATFDSVLTWATNRFTNPAVRTVASFGGTRAGNDYRPGHGELLIWGRPGLFGEHGREARLYLLRHALPLPIDDHGALRFEPLYFAGLDSSGEPIWSEHESDAQPLALDGEPGGDPHEPVSLVGTMTVSWLGPPIDKWVMLYGGDFPDFLVHDGPHARLHGGGIMMRFADHPWGPWSRPTPHLSPGLPTRAGDPYGPGGFLYHPECVDLPDLTCARSDPNRPAETVLEGCPVSAPEIDPGRLYGVNIIDAYTGANDEGGLDLSWTVSTWNPYTVQLMTTRLQPADLVEPQGGEVANARALARMSDWRALPSLPERMERYVQQTSRDRGTEDTSFPLSDNGNRDFNNFLCASADAQLGPLQFAPFRFDLPACEESYVKGAVLGRFEGSGRLVRIWIGMASLLLGPADQEILRIYADDDPTPIVEVPLAEAMDGSAGEIFAPPFGAGSPRRLAWYYPVSFDRKLVVALDNLGDLDEYFYHCDVALLPEPPPPSERPRARLPERDRVIAQLTAVYRPAGRIAQLGARESIALAPGASRTIVRPGPATIHELRVRVAEETLPALAGVQVRVRWDGADEPAIDLPLLELLAADAAPPERSSLALTSYLEWDQRTLALKLPMPFTSEAEWTFDNQGDAAVAFDLELSGDAGMPAAGFGYLHVDRSSAAANGDPYHVAAQIEGRGRLVGLCGRTEGVPDDAGGFQYDPLNLLEGDVQVRIDGKLALDGTGTEEYADDIFYFTDAPHGSPFVQAWGVIQDLEQIPPGQASFCRWHVLGTELDFAESLELRFELGGAGNPWIVTGHRTVAYYYLEGR